MKKLMILSTGGTIACTQTAEGLIPTLSADDILAYAPEAKRLGKIETRTILNLDSSNIQPEEWRLIAGGARSSAAASLPVSKRMRLPPASTSTR